jgi:replicative DNA helicase
MLFRRETLDRLKEMAIVIEKANPKECRLEIVHKANKIQVLEHRLLRRNSVSVESMAERTSEQVNSGASIIQTGFPFINSRLRGLTRRQVSSLLAMPGHMKSSFTDCLLSRTVEFNPVKALIISLEDPTEERVKRIVSSRLNLSLKDMRFGKVKLSAKDIERVFKVHLNSRLTIYDTRDVLTPDDAVAAINDVKADLVLIDHIQEFDMPDMVIGLIRAVRSLKAAASRNNCHILITSQVPDKQFGNREKKDPTPADAQWTSALRQASSEMFSLRYPHQDTHNEFDAYMLNFNIIKSRYADAVSRMTLEINPDQANIIREIPKDGSTSTTNHS